MELIKKYQKWAKENEIILEIKGDRNTLPWWMGILILIALLNLGLIPFGGRFPFAEP